MRSASAAIALLCIALVSPVLAFDPLQADDRAPASVERRVKDVIHRLGVAIKAKNLAGFHDSPVMSAAFAQQVSAAQMAAAFKPLIDGGVDLTTLDKAHPQFDGIAQVDTDNQLIVKGGYASDPPTLFEMRFVREGDKLGLSFVDVHLAVAPKSDAAGLRAILADPHPAKGVAIAPAEMRAVRAAMHAFGVAVNHRNMDEFLKSDIVSQYWREHQTAAQVAADYRTTIATRGDFTMLDPLEPVIIDAPGKNARGITEFTGYYGAPDARIGFKMGFVDEAGSLRLINFSIAPPRRAAAK
ncbi:hypothetical protein [Rudaea sp.]|uniref:hypothetical protein n=1 Tax=Rudaea sp. TaxID=2136325 RepID=UPI002ED13CCE